VLPWLVSPSPQNWICWKESEVNSIARRTWTKQAAEFLAAHYVAGQGILTPSASDDLAGIFCRARIPLRETINVGTEPAWMANTARPDLIHQQAWAIYQQDDGVARALSKHRSPYVLAKAIDVKGASEVAILHRTGQ
jgi:hypothetical protein